MAKWIEALHPRDMIGRFASLKGGRGGKVAPEPKLTDKQKKTASTLHQKDGGASLRSGKELKAMKQGAAPKTEPGKALGKPAVQSSLAPPMDTGKPPAAKMDTGNALGTSKPKLALGSPDDLQPAATGLGLGNPNLLDAMKGLGFGSASDMDVGRYKAGSVESQLADTSGTRTVGSLESMYDQSIPDFNSDLALNVFMNKRFPGKRFGIVADPKYRRRIAMHLDALSKAYPRTWDKAIKTVGVPGPIAALILRNAYAGYSGQKRHLVLNPKYFRDANKMDKSLKNSERTGWSPRGTGYMEAILTHEFGHAYDEMRKRRMKEESPDHYKFLEDSTSHVFQKGADGKYTAQKKSMYSENAPSQYAVTAPEEYFAESFTDAHHGTNPTRYSKRLKNVIDRLDLSQDAPEYMWELIRERMYEDAARSSDLS